MAKTIGSRARNWRNNHFWLKENANQAFKNVLLKTLDFIFFQGDIKHFIKFENFGAQILEGANNAI